MKMKALQTLRDAMLKQNKHIFIRRWILCLTSPLSGVNLVGSLMTRLWRPCEMGVVSCGSTSISSSSLLGSHSEHCLLTNIISDINHTCYPVNRLHYLQKSLDVEILDI